MNLNCILKGEISISLTRLHTNIIQFDRSFDPIIAFTCLSIEGIKTLSRDYDGQQNRSSLCEKSPSFDCENKLTNLERAVRLSPTERFNHFCSRKGSSEYFQNTKKDQGIDPSDAECRIVHISYGFRPVFSLSNPCIQN